MEIKNGISDGEWSVLNALWKRSRGTAREFQEDLQEERGWSYSTVKTLLDRMKAKGLVRARRVGNVWEYRPAIKHREAVKDAWKAFVRRAFDGVGATALGFVASESDLTDKQREELQRVLLKLEENQ